MEQGSSRVRERCPGDGLGLISMALDRLPFTELAAAHESGAGTRQKVSCARSVAHHATIAARSDHWQGLILAVKAGAGLAAMPHFQGDNERDLVRVIDNIGL